MNFKSIQKIGLLATVVTALSGLSSPAFADATIQAFSCDSLGSVSIQNGTSHDKKFLIPGINKIAVLVDSNTTNPVGINYAFNPPIPFRFITWYYKEAFGSNALKGMNVRYCVSLADGSQMQSFDVAGGVNNRGGSVGDGWSDVVQDTRSFPSIVTSGNAVLSKLTFFFKDSNNQNNITLGRVSIDQNAVSASQITDLGPCSLGDPCIVPGK